jgi:hypothetical protein
MTDVIERVAVWKRGTAAFLDFFTVFFVGGYLIAHYTGETTDNGGFNLKGGRALVLLALIGLYFFIGRRCAGGTLWDRIFRIGRSQPD